MILYLVFLLIFIISQYYWKNHYQSLTFNKISHNDFSKISSQPKIKKPSIKFSLPLQNPTPILTPTSTPILTPTSTPILTPTPTPILTPTSTPILTHTSTPILTPTPALPTSSQYNYISKTVPELLPYEYQDMNNFWEQFFKKDIITISTDMGLKDNTRIFLCKMANHSDQPSQSKIVGQCYLLIIDEHDLYSAFSRFNKLNLALDSVILYNLCVDLPYRKQGIAKNLLKIVEEWCKSNQKKKIVLFVDQKNHPALNLYTKNGYQIDQLYKPINTDNDKDEYNMYKSLVN